MTGQDDSKFGFGLASGAAAEAVLRLRHPTSGARLVGVHAHIGSQIFVLESFERALALLVPFFSDLEVDELCIGGGLGVAYVSGERPHRSPSGRRRCTRRPRPPASPPMSSSPPSLAAPSWRRQPLPVTAWAPSRRFRALRTYVSVDGGMSDNPRPVLYGSGYEAFLPREVSARRPLVATIVGKHCESGDVIVRDAGLPSDLAIGDILATPVTGAYGHSMASTYNKVPRPPVVFVRDGGWRVVVRRETYEDLLALDVEDVNTQPSRAPGILDRGKSGH